MNCRWQRALRPDLLAKVEARIEERVRREAGSEPEGRRETEAAALRLAADVEVAGVMRQRLGRMTRKTLSFSKSLPNHLGCLRDFIHDYNNQLTIT